MRILKGGTSIRLKLLVGCGALAGVLFAVSAAQWYSTLQLADTAREALLADAQAEALLLNIDRDGYQAQIAVEQLASAPEDHVVDLLDSYEGNRDQTLSRWEAYVGLARGLGDERDRWPLYDEARARWVEHNDDLVARLQSGDRSDNPQIVADLVLSRSLHGELRGVVDGIVEEIYVPYRETFEVRLTSDINVARLVLPIGLLIGIVVSIGVALLLARNIASPIRRITDRARQIADGCLDLEPIGLKRNDELGALADSFNDMSAMLQVVGQQAQCIAAGNVSADVLDQEVAGELGTSFGTMIESLRSTITEINAESQHLTQAAQELVGASDSMQVSAVQTSEAASSATSAGTEISNSVDIVARSIEDMTGSIHEIAASASEASEVAGQAVEVASTTSATIEKLGESSEEIGNVISVITSIAEQTNLLALNATIEAARAGQAGKGFAVVASEVKALATQTGQATEEIASRIQAIQADTVAAVAANHEISQTIEQISHISSTIAAAVEEQSITTSTIGQNIELASLQANNIATSVADVAAAAESTRTSTDETSTSAGGLSHMANKLSKLVANYH